MLFWIIMEQLQTLFSWEIWWSLSIGISWTSDDPASWTAARSWIHGKVNKYLLAEMQPQDAINFRQSSI